MELLLPGVGLIFWQALGFIILLIFLGKFAWGPILNALKIREQSIDQALEAAEKAREDMAKLQAENNKLLDEARLERDKILKEAKEASAKMLDKAKEDASKTTEKMIADAKASIDAEKKSALKEVKNQVAELSLEIAEKVIKNQLSDDKKQKDLVEEYVKDINLN
ncbi:F0F1 ATP synthase subunit B [Marinigracilibium pacificum]|uniref:ATP synthase subunit b n=1 Tax=Marinigracilibium pacificum TaxID=2729599 RepID=A0A848J1S9_9BACT|nr:F0F1 ATP synthase subunit B [Marinigracilibium pacificum]NMM47162.1 F0F1 ATP synthase subunit B [Marinigracilibium pacificum]